MSLAKLCGQLLVVGLAGTELGEGERKALERGERGGIILFKRNVDAGTGRILALTQAIRAASPEAPFVAIDQEGGRVLRIGPPVIQLPFMRRVGDLGDLDFTARLAEAHARELSALGINMSFAPVADVHTRPENPIIGQRAFAETPERVFEFARAWVEGLARGKMLSCAKHFPGHGDTTVDSHLALPRVERDRAGLDAIEIAPFRALAKEPKVASMLVAHVVYPALDPERPASLSRAICTDLLRRELGFQGVLFTDDMEMKAISLPMGDAVLLAINAGCDVPLICHKEELVEEALAALVHEAEKSPAFKARCEEAHGRFLAMRRRVPSEPVADEAALAGVFEGSRAITAELASRVGG
jgi:beta-N-acetylhexosaminidase